MSKIQLKGIIRNTPGAISADGECDEMINLRFKDGSFRPILDNSPINATAGTLSPNTVSLYIHSNQDYNHVLAVETVSGVSSLVHIATIDPITGNFVYLSSSITICTLTFTDKLPTFTQVGNVVNIADSDALKYAIWYNGAYTFIDASFDGASDGDYLTPTGRIDFKVDGVVNGSNVRETRSYFTGVGTDLASRQAAATGLFNKAISQQTTDGRFTGFFLVCTAIELFDGSYILHSNPLLMGQAWDASTRYHFTGNRAIDYITAPAVFEVYKPGGPLTGDYQTTYSDTVYCFDSNSMSADILVQAPNLYGFVLSTQSGELRVGSSGESLKIHPLVTIDHKYDPLIKSVSVFVTLQVSMYNNDIVTNPANYNEGSFSVSSYMPTIKSNADIIKEIQGLNTFYKIKEYTIDDWNAAVTAASWIDLTPDLAEDVLTNVASLETLPIDNYSHHKVLPSYQFVYNSKLHIADYTQIYSHGFPLDYFNYTNGIGQFQATTTNALTWNVSVVLKTDNGFVTVVRSGYSSILRDKNPILSYPDNRAVSMTISEDTIAYGGSQTYKLTPHDTFNFSYYIEPNLMEIDPCVNAPLSTPSELNNNVTFPNVLKCSDTSNPFTFPVANTYTIGNGKIVGMEANTIALSQGQFGDHPVYVFCSDGIWAMYLGGAAINYSSVKPLSREVCNNSNSIKAIDTGVIFTTDKGVMILSGAKCEELSVPVRGDYFDFTNSDSYDYMDTFTNANFHPRLVRLTNEMSSDTFLDYVTGSIVGYNYIEKEVIFYNTSKSYAYVFSHGIWFKISLKATQFVDSYPKQFYFDYSTLNMFDINSTSGVSKPCMLLTRPLKLGDQVFKEVLTSILRGNINIATADFTGLTNRGTFSLLTTYAVNDYVSVGLKQYKCILSTLNHDVSNTTYWSELTLYAGIYVYGSYDCNKWMLLGGCEKTGQLRDLGTRVERTDCKYFKIGFVGNLNANSTIDYIELEAKKSILNKKLR